MSKTFIYLRAKHSGLVLNVAEASRDRGVPVIQWPASGPENDLWELVPIGAGFFNVLVKHSGLALNVEGASTDDGARLIQWPLSGTDNEKWSLVSVGDGFYRLIAKHSGKALNVQGGSVDNGASIIQWPISGTDNEKWSIVAAGMRMMGMVSIKSVHGRYLQAHDDDGEMHASNEDLHTEETWHLIQVDANEHVYVLMNWHNRRFMSKRGNCAPAISEEIGDKERWILVAGEPYGVSGAVAIVSEPDGTFLWANSPGDDTDCGGEVRANAGAPPMNNPRWGGWWYMSPASTPTPGRTWGDFWTTVKWITVIGGVVGSLLGGEAAEEPANMDEVTKA